MKKQSLIWVAFLLIGTASAWADDIVILERTANNFDSRAATPGGHEHVLAAISRETSVPVVDLEAQRDRTGLGYGGLFMANSLASATGKTFEEIAALKASGHGWGWIAKQNNVKLGPIVSRARHADKTMKPDDRNVKKVKQNKEKKFFDDDFDRPDRGPGNSHGQMKGPKSNGNFHSKGHGKGH
jgi:hypothetical protein